MKTTVKFFTLILLTILFTGCSKKEVVLTQDQQTIKFLTGSGVKYWRIKKILVNDVEQVLTPNQLRYTKTYTLTPGETTKGSFTNFDNYTGTWQLNGIQLIEKIILPGVGVTQFPYTINHINDSELEIEYIINYTDTKEIYNAN